MTRLLTIFEESKRTTFQAEIVRRSEEFRASPTVKIGLVTVLNPTYEGPNPFQVPELLDPENEGVLRTPVEALLDPELVQKKRRNRAKSEAHTKRPWPLEKQRTIQSLRNSAPPLSTPISTPGYMSDDDPFRKDPLSPTTAAPNSFFMEEEKKKVRRRTVGFSVDYLHVEIPDERL
ncbi:hypothetical protein B0H19DRAFT_1266286 [Mycena capillaripes]|nr:hypothetical protein B0H19DRAFT_1266286 [Mycena capillaripes]